MDPSTILPLLHRVSVLKSKYEEIAKHSGENFNIFRIIKKAASEVHVHSAFLAELLNPKGAHGQGRIFLQLFLSQLEIKEFNTENISVKAEHFAGIIDWDNPSGGSIDLLISNASRQAIIIENKINAGDQKLQLLRYYQYGEAYFPGNFHLFYLTLNGHEPSSYSTGSKLKRDTHFHTISYKQTIIPWLEACRKESVLFPILRETITQYIHLIKYLTGQTINHTMEKEIINKITADPETFEAALAIANAIDQAKVSLQQRLISQLKKVAKELKLTAEDFNERFGLVKGETELNFRLDQLNCPELIIEFGFMDWNRQFSIGIHHYPEVKKLDPGWKETISKSRLGHLIGENERREDHFPGYYYIHFFKEQSGLENWEDPAIWRGIINGTLVQKLKNNLEIILNELRSIGILPDPQKQQAK